MEVDAQGRPLAVFVDVDSGELLDPVRHEALSAHLLARIFPSLQDHYRAPARGEVQRCRAPGDARSDDDGVDLLHAALPRPSHSRVDLRPTATARRVARG